MSDFTEYVELELPYRTSIDTASADIATGSFLVKADNTFSRDYDALSQGTSGQILSSQGTGALPTWIDSVAFDINGLDADTIDSVDTVAFYDNDGAHNNKITFVNFESTLDHNNLTNTHNLTTDIDHDTITNTHNLTTDIDHDSIVSGTIADHDTSATGTQLDTLTDNSIANNLHRHSELVASDGSPDPALSINADGNINAPSSNFSLGGYFDATNVDGYGVHGGSVNSFGVSGTSTNDDGVRAFSTNGTGIAAGSGTGLAGYFYRDNVVETATTPVMEISQISASDTNTVLKVQGKGTGDLLVLFDSVVEVLSVSAGGDFATVGTIGGINVTSGEDPGHTHTSASIPDHNSLINTHNLTTDIDHDTITNTHNLTTDIDHDSIVSGTIADHDTSATGTQLNTLTDNSIANTLHRHSELVASDGTPDPALSVDASGNFDFGDGNLTTTGNITTTGGGQTGKFLTGLAGYTVLAYDGLGLDIRAGSGGTTEQNVLRMDNSGNFDFYDGNLTTTGTVQGVTQAEFNTLTDNSIANDLHRHSELVASDGSPDPALLVDATGKIGVGTDNPQRTLHLYSSTIGLRFERPGVGIFDFSVSNIMSSTTNDWIVTAQQASAGFVFRVRNAGNTIIVALGIDRDGNIGINTISPDAKLQVVGDVKIGDDNTNYTTISNTGDVTFTGSSGLIIGSMHIPGADIIVLVDGTNPTEVESGGDGWAAGELNGVTFPTSGTEHYLTITKTGKYEVIWNMSYHADTGGTQEIHGGVMIDNVALRDCGEAHRTVSNANDSGNMGAPCFIDCPNGNEEISLWIINSASYNVHVGHATVTVKLIAGT